MTKQTEAQKQLKKAQQEALKNAFLTHWRQLGGPELEEEYRFHPTRRWAFDFANRATCTAIEVEGGTFLDKSRHTTGKGYAEDCHKYNQAQILGWRVFRFTTDMLKNDPVGHLAPVIELMSKERARE